MSKKSSAFDNIWNKVFLRAVTLCEKEMDSEFKNKANVVFNTTNEYKNELNQLYKNKREWLKKEYLPNEKEPILDFHKLSSITCRCIIGKKPVSFDVKVAEKMFLSICSDESFNQIDEVNWQIDNVYINYKIAFLVAEGINFIDLIYWAHTKIDDIQNKYTEEEIANNFENTKDKIEIYEEFILLLNKEEHRLYRYEGSSSHDNFMVSQIIALMKNDCLKRDFDYLQFAISMFQWQEYTKKQHLYDILKSKCKKISLYDLV